MPLNSIWQVVIAVCYVGNCGVLCNSSMKLVVTVMNYVDVVSDQLVVIVMSYVGVVWDQ